ncbi:uncharacterized protein EV420DRAFT_1322514 [Desarmillaria tabescens]|uniref:DNA/RNA-binding domain-containing protein n=1 Tax=Armillaria tabescens TaxID=1929756 RepID=A0AA39U1X3_ARMTA|nr:uncharacterized protein EV420DRAFT_1322514 [Desarmillaria tabescens]KAK0469064.1 hypothetical protein EV420DRAFT_1322514 [Desarmillaria tabescens]
MEDPQSTLKEAKGLHQILKESLKKKEPFDKETDFQRKNLRRCYLNLLLLHPYEPESQDAENHLWMQTSYAIISVYKQRIATLDRILQSQPQQHHQHGHGPVEYRKLVQRFRQFLAEEEKFWSQLVTRYQRSFGLDEAKSALVTLEIIPATGTPDNDATPPNGRNHFQFPRMESTESVIPTTPEEREDRLSILSKALVCLGDIARYREQYNEGGGRSKIGHDDFPRRGRNRRGGAPGGESLPRPRNYSKARLCYEQARLLVPHDGNPSHQLAILASYQKDSFESLAHYYRALCVRQPYDTAAENMGTVLTKALEQWKVRSKKEKDTGPSVDPSQVPKIIVVTAFKEKIVILHALWRLGLQKMDSLTRKQSKEIYTELIDLVSGRHLPEDFIIRIFVTAHGALWKHRMFRDSPASVATRKAADSSPSSTLSPTVIEARILCHVLLLHRALLEVGIEELKVPLDDVEQTDLAQRITATFRRTLKALRVASKWLRANYAYVLEKGKEFRDDASEIAEFWSVFAKFISALSHVFPVDRLPELKFGLEEDVELQGFLPLKMAVIKRHTEGEEQGHPNIEQLMRISDLLMDAQFFADEECSPLHTAGILSSKTSIPASLSTGSTVALVDHFVPYLSERKEDEVMTEATSDTNDDIIHAAFEHLNAQEQDEEDENEEMVLYPRPTPPTISPVSRPTPITPIKPLSPIAPPATSPLKNRSPLITPKTAHPPITAQDLLHTFMSVPRTASRSISESRPPLLFGPEPNQPRSIWSAVQDEPSLQPPGHKNQSPLISHSQLYETPPSAPQATWPPPLSSSTQVPQTYIPGSIPSASFPSQSQSSSLNHHQRNLSANVGNLRAPGLSPNMSQHYVSGYPPPIEQPTFVGGTHELYPPTATAMDADVAALYYPASPTHPIHSRHMSLDPRQAYMTPSVWGPAG